MPLPQKIHVHNIILIVSTVFLVGIGIVGTVHSAVDFLHTDLPFTEIPLSLMKIYVCIIAPIIMIMIMYGTLKK